MDTLIQTKKHLPYRWIILSALLLLVGILTVVGYKGFKHWRAMGLIRSATELSADPLRWSEAISRAQSAYALQPGNLQIIRTVARLLEMQNPEAAIDFWIQAGSHSRQAPDDVIALLRCYNSVKRYHDSAKLVESLDRVSYKSSSYYNAKAQYLAGINRYPEALQCVEAILHLPDSPEDAPFVYFRTVLLIGDIQARENAENLLWQLARQGGKRAPEAIRNLLYHGQSLPLHLAELESLAEKQLTGTREDRLLLRQLQLRLHTMPREKILPLLFKEFGDRKGDDLVALSRWLFDESLFDVILDTIPEADALKRKDLCLLYFDSLLAVGKTDEMGKLLALSRLPLEEYLRAYYTARVSRQAGNFKQSALHWEQALSQARDDPEQLWFLIQAAGQLGLTDQVRSALERLAVLPATKRIAYQLLISSSYQQGSTSGLLESLLQLHTLYPNDPSVRNDLIYIRLLREDGLAARLPEAEQLCVENPLQLSHRITYALALLKNGHPVEAMQVLDATKIDWNQAQERFRVVYATVLQANDRRPEAQETIRGLNATTLLPEEQKLLRMISP